MTQIKNKNILITGGASGIGKIMTRICLEKGASNVIVWDLNPQGAEEDARVKAYKVNVAKPEEISDTYAKVKADVGQVDILINNAGIVRGNNTFDKQTPQDIMLSMDVNATAPMLVAQAMMPDMVARDSGHICNIASAAGMLGIPKLSVYCASKWAVVGWTESMNLELIQMKSNVKATVITPYFINTGMFDGVKSKVFPILDPEKTSAKIIRAIEKNHRFKGLPFTEHFIRFCQGILPYAFLNWFFGKVFGVYEVMDHFTGRKA